MARPPKLRTVCKNPEYSRFFSEPCGAQVFTLAVEEFEVIRLMDAIGLTQQECAQQMGVARTTVQRIYCDARKKLAAFITSGGTLCVGGGSYGICHRSGAAGCGRGFCCKRAYDNNSGMEVLNLKIAVTYDNGQVFDHFGLTKTFKIYDIEGGKVVSSHLLSSGDSGHGALAGLLGESGVTTLICGGIGAGAKNALAQAKIELYAGTSGDADEQVEAFLRGELSYNPDTICEHHTHEGEAHEHVCGEHGCGR